MAAWDITALDGTLKYMYPEAVHQDLTYRQQAIMPFLKRILRPAGGKQQNFQVETYASESSRFCKESPTLITPTVGQFAEGSVTLKNMYTRQYMGQSAIDDSKNDKSAIVNLAVWLPKRLTREHAFKIARNAWCENGVLATCGTTTASTTVVLASNANMRRFVRGMIVDIVNTTDAIKVTNGDSVTISSVDEVNKKIVIDGSGVTTDSADGVCIEDEDYDSGGGVYATYCWNSLPTLIGTGDVHGIVVATYPEFKSYVSTSVGTLSQAKMQKIVNEIEAKHQGGINVIYASPEALVKYGDLLIGDMRYDPKDFKKMIGGYPTNMVYSGGAQGYIPIVKDALMPEDEMYFINESAFRVFNSAWLKWFDADGNYIHRVSGTFDYELLYYSRADMAIINRLGSGKATGITV